MAEREDTVPFAVPDLTDREAEAVRRTLESGWITTGPKTAEFEQRFAEAVGAAHAVAVNSCTAAMHLSLEALGVGAGELVYMSPYTFAATAEVVRYLGATPVFVDIDPVTLNVDPALLRARIERDLEAGEARPAVIMPVHIAGVPCAMDEIWAIAREHGLDVVEDAAHAFPASRDGVTVGRGCDGVRGTVCFSFYATKTLTTGEGGMIVTHDADLAERARMMSLHGLSRQAWGRYAAGGSWRYDIVAPGYKYNLTDVAAAMGLVQLERSAEMLRARRSIARRYTERFAVFDELQTPTVPPGVDSAWHLYPLRLSNRGRHSRDALVDHLADRGIGTSVHFIPLHLHSYYREAYGYRPEDFPQALGEFERVVSLPIFSAMTDQQVARVVEAVAEFAGG